MRKYHVRIGRDILPLINLVAQRIGTVLSAATYHLLEPTTPEGERVGRSTRLLRTVGRSHG